jgi:hypothetical protein
VEAVEGEKKRPLEAVEVEVESAESASGGGSSKIHSFSSSCK